jgi:solute carrier family 29 (equilibrative nucleoside transporter), member 1/2/3
MMTLLRVYEKVCHSHGLSTSYSSYWVLLCCGHGEISFSARFQAIDISRNMFLAAAPYFQKRFHNDEWILAHFQSSIISVSTVTNLASMLILSNLQSKASYQKRIASALMINIVVFSLLALSTTYFREVSAGVYLGFVLAMVFFTSLATGLIQNGSFAFAAGFGRPQYMQANMAGQAIAGVLPPIAQIVSVLGVPPQDQSHSMPRDNTSPPPIPPKQSSTAAFIYFMTATAVCIITLLAFIPLVRRHNRLMEGRMMESITSIEEAERARRKVVSLWTLYKKLHWLAAAVFMCFAVTMFFPVFTAQIVSNMPPDGAPRLFQPAVFIPLAFLIWNAGDLSGRLSTLLPFSLRHRPALLFVISIARLGFIPLYMLCNVRGRGAVISSDVFYLFIVQLGFGLTNGWLGSSCMMAALEWVEDGEREASGGFMGLNLVAGLTVGSLLSFTAAGP